MGCPKRLMFSLSLVAGYRNATSRTKKRHNDIELPDNTCAFLNRSDPETAIPYRTCLRLTPTIGLPRTNGQTLAFRWGTIAAAATAPPKSAAKCRHERGDGPKMHYYSLARQAEMTMKLEEKLFIYAKSIFRQKIINSGNCDCFFCHWVLLPLRTIFTHSSVSPFFPLPSD